MPTSCHCTGKSSTKILVDFDRELVMVDATTQGNNAIRAGPLLGPKGTVSIHAYIDHSIIAVIFNNQTRCAAPTTYRCRACVGLCRQISLVPG